MLAELSKTDSKTDNKTDMLWKHCSLLEIVCISVLDGRVWFASVAELVSGRSVNSVTWVRVLAWTQEMCKLLFGIYLLINDLYDLITICSTIITDVNTSSFGSKLT